MVSSGPHSILCWFPSAFCCSYLVAPMWMRELINIITCFLVMQTQLSLTPIIPAPLPHVQSLVILKLKGSWVGWNGSTWNDDSLWILQSNKQRLFDSLLTTSTSSYNLTSNYRSLIKPWSTLSEIKQCPSEAARNRSCFRGSWDMCVVASPPSSRWGTLTVPSADFRENRNPGENHGHSLGCAELPVLRSPSCTTHLNAHRWTTWAVCTTQCGLLRASVGAVQWQLGHSGMRCLVSPVEVIERNRLKKRNFCFIWN